MTQYCTKITSKKSGDYSKEATPVPISNTVVKLFCADDTWRATAWESRTSPVFLIRLHGQAVKTPPFHGGNPGSIPGGVTNRARVAELADALDLGSSGRPWGFKSLRAHHKNNITSGWYFFVCIGLEPERAAIVKKTACYAVLDRRSKPRQMAQDGRREAAV